MVFIYLCYLYMCAQTKMFFYCDWNKCLCQNVSGQDSESYFVELQCLICLIAYEISYYKFDII